jgi:hypothetical protein
MAAASVVDRNNNAVVSAKMQTNMHTNINLNLSLTRSEISFPDLKHSAGRLPANLFSALLFDRILPLVGVVIMDRPFESSFGLK